MHERLSVRKRVKLQAMSAWMGLFCPFAGPAGAKGQVIHRASLYSAALHEKRSIRFILPKNYKPGSSERYDVLYVLDGATTYHSLVAEQLGVEGFIPRNIIVVGIPNVIRKGVNLRDRDFTPTHTPVSAVSGGAEVNPLDETHIGVIDLAFG